MLVGFWLNENLLLLAREEMHFDQVVGRRNVDPSNKIGEKFGFEKF